MSVKSKRNEWLRVTLALKGLLALEKLLQGIPALGEIYKMHNVDIIALLRPAVEYLTDRKRDLQ